MSDFFSSLLDRTLERAPVLQPRHLSLYESARDVREFGVTALRSQDKIEDNASTAALPSWQKMATPRGMDALSDSTPAPVHQYSSEVSRLQGLSSIRMEYPLSEPTKFGEHKSLPPVTPSKAADSGKATSENSNPEGRETESNSETMPFLKRENKWDVVPEHEQTQNKSNEPETKHTESHSETMSFLKRENKWDVVPEYEQTQSKSNEPETKRTESNSETMSFIKREKKWDVVPEHEQTQNKSNEPETKLTAAHPDNKVSTKLALSPMPSRKHEFDSNSKSSRANSKIASTEAVENERTRIKKPREELELLRPVQKIPAAVIVPVKTSRPAPLTSSVQHALQNEAVPTINVTIGRIEVRATQAPTASPKHAQSSAPKMSLEDYLRSRSGGPR